MAATPPPALAAAAPRIKRWRACVTLCLALLMAAGAAPPCRAQAGAPASEEAVKAAYLLKLRNYVEWPPAALAAQGGKLVIGVIGGDEIAGRLLELSAARADARLVVRRLRAGEALDGVAIVFIDDAHWRKAGATLALARASPVLVVSESAGALDGGSIINFRIVDERIRFEISLANAEHSGLKLSSGLLALAIAVVRQ